MKKGYFYFLLIVIMVGCSPTDPEDNSEPEPQQGPIRQISKMEGHDDARFHYEDGLLIKGVGNSGSNHTRYHAAFQIEYKTNKQINRVLVVHTAGSFVKPINFNFDLKGFEYLEIYNYNYTNNKLSSITSESGEILEEFFYDSQGRVNKHKYFDAHYPSWIEYEYIYDSAGKLDKYIYKKVSTGETRYGRFESDDKVNPFYNFWVENSFIMPSDFTYIMDFNYSFYPHNITAVYQADVKWFGVHIEYEGDYPIIYDVDDSSNSTREPTRFTYIN